MPNAEYTLQEAQNAFDFGAPIKEVARFGCGHINDTFCVTTQALDGTVKRFILQRISSAAFKNPRELMSNVVSVTKYLSAQIKRAGGDSSRETMSVKPTRNGENYFTDSQGEAWRVYTFVENTVCYQSASSPELFAAAGWTFGHFQQMLVDYPADTLYETIPNFHDTVKRFENLKAAIESDSLGRKKTCEAEIKFALDHEKDCPVAYDALNKGILPLRVTHNDTKLNNVLFDKQTGKGICVIDLDTVMPGLSIFDFGDAIRFGANHCAEDEPDLSKVAFDVNLYESYADAFIAGAGDALTDAEISYLPWGAKIMTLECGMRFLADYLEGDTYFHISREGHNLDRARVQFRLVADIEAHWDEINRISEKYIADRAAK